MYGRYFYYNSHTSQEFGLTIGGFNYTESPSLAMSRTVYKGTFTKVRKIPNFMGTEYTDVLRFKISLIKDPCLWTKITQDAFIFTEDEVDEITSWLTEPNYPTLFHMYDYEPDVYNKYDYFAVCEDIQPQVLSGDIYGFDITFVTNAPYAWSDIITNEIENSGEQTYLINVNNSERLGMIFPTITILPDLDNPQERIDVSIGNLRDGNQMDISILKDETMIDCQRSMIFSQAGLLTFDDLGLDSVDNIYWFRLYNGTNRVTLSGDATFTFEYREPRKVGAY